MTTSLLRKKRGDQRRARRTDKRPDEKVKEYGLKQTPTAKSVWWLMLQL